MTNSYRGACRIHRALEEYKRIIPQLRKGARGGREYAGAFYADDVAELVEIMKTYPAGSTVFAFFRALEAGWMMGYKYAKRAKNTPDVPDDGTDPAEEAAGLEPLGAFIDRRCRENGLTVDGM